MGLMKYPKWKIFKHLQFMFQGKNDGKNPSFPYSKIPHLDR
jgi:hypothetical protein